MSLGTDNSTSTMGCGADCDDEDVSPFLQNRFSMLRQDIQRFGQLGTDPPLVTSKPTLQAFPQPQLFEMCFHAKRDAGWGKRSSTSLQRASKCDGLKLQKETPTGIQVTGCCPTHADWCGGCEEEKEGGGACKSCAGGFVLEDGYCIRHNLFKSVGTLACRFMPDLSRRPPPTPQDFGCISFLSKLSREICQKVDVAWFEKLQRLWWTAWKLRCSCVSWGEVAGSWAS